MRLHTTDIGFIQYGMHHTIDQPVCKYTISLCRTRAECIRASETGDVHLYERNGYKSAAPL